MKRTLTLILALSGLLLSCSKEESGVLITVSEDSFEINAEGGSFSFTYKLGGGIDSGSVTCTGDVSWLSDINASQSGVVNFTVGANPQDEVRTGNITISARYGSSDQLVRKRIGVIQYASSVRLSVPASVLVSSDGGSYSFSYSLEGGADNHDIRCSADADWVGGFDCSSGNTVQFTVEPKFVEQMRTATITLTYIDIYRQVTAEVPVIQDHPRGEGDYDYSDIIGTYTASGITYDGETQVEEAWTMTIIPDETFSSILWIDGLLPDTVGDSAYGTDYMPYCTVSEDHTQIIVQLPYVSPSTATSYEYYRGFVVCPEAGYYNYDRLTFTYDPAFDLWESDYGVNYGLFWYQSVTWIVSVYSSVLPTITLLKGNSGAASARTGCASFGKELGVSSDSLMPVQFMQTAERPDAETRRTPSEIEK